MSMLPPHRRPALVWAFAVCLALVASTATWAADSPPPVVEAYRAQGSPDSNVITSGVRFQLSGLPKLSAVTVGRRAQGTQDPLVDVPFEVLVDHRVAVDIRRLPPEALTIVATLRDDRGREATGSIDVQAVSWTLAIAPQKIAVTAGAVTPVTGRLLDDRGNPVPGTAVRADRSERGGPPTTCGQATSGPDGRYTIPCLFRVSAILTLLTPSRSSGSVGELRPGGAQFVKARPLVTLAADRPVRRRGTVSVLTGAISPSPAEIATYGLRTPVPVTKRIVLEVARAGSRTFRLVRVAATNPAGQFTVRYRWPARRGPDGPLRLRVRVAGERPWPLAEGVSTPVVVTVSRVR